jgi:hypothetical protein
MARLFDEQRFDEAEPKVIGSDELTSLERLVAEVWSRLSAAAQTPRDPHLARPQTKNALAVEDMFHE